jgi:hypothetical protein
MRFLRGSLTAVFLFGLVTQAQGGGPEAVDLGKNPSILDPNHSVVAAGGAHAQGTPCPSETGPVQIDPSWLQDPPSTHGMAILGRGPRFFVSHLPMFMSPHDYQAIFEVEITGPGGTAATHQAADQLLTLAPASSVLARWAQGAPATGFAATIFSGHFERGGTAIGPARIRVIRTVYFHKLDPAATRPAHPRLILFSDGTRTYGAHEIVRPPDHDQLMRMDNVNPRVTQLLHDRSFLTVEENGTSNDPIGVGTTVHGRIPSAPSAGVLDAVRVAAETYVENGPGSDLNEGP